MKKKLYNIDQEMSLPVSINSPSAPIENHDSGFVILAKELRLLRVEFDVKFGHCHWVFYFLIGRYNYCTTSCNSSLKSAISSCSYLRIYICKANYSCWQP